jgi:hypothetical protein
VEINNIKFLTSGCSFSAEEWSWPSLLPNYKNLAEHGSGNTYIRRQIQKEIFEKSDDYDFVIVQWSTIDRWDYPFKIQTEDDTPLIKMNVDKFDIDNKVGYYRMGTNLDSKSIHFYKNYYSIYGQLLETLESIYYLQLTLENLKKPYLMFTIANFLTTDITFDTIKNIKKIKGDLMQQRISNLKLEKVFETFQSVDLLNTLSNKIDWNKFVWTTDFKIGNIGDGFTEYLITKKQNFEHNDNTHPSELQNKMFFDEILKPRIIGELLK